MQACRELLAERMFKAHKTLSVRQTNMLLEKTDGKPPLFFRAFFFFLFAFFLVAREEEGMPVAGSFEGKSSATSV